MVTWKPIVSYLDTCHGEDDNFASQWMDLFSRWVHDEITSQEFMDLTDALERGQDK